MEGLAQAPAHAPATVAPFVAADIGGTHARLGLAEPRAGEDGPVHFLDYRTYRCADYRGLDEILDQFLGDARGKVRHGVIASAGYALDDGTVVGANLRWPLPIEQLRARFGLDELHLINDFAALAHAASRIPPEHTLLLTGPDAATTGPILVLGPGTGLGAALCIPTQGRPLVLPSEAGQATLAVRSELELAILARLQQQHAHVSIEHALSGPGLANLYRAVCELHGRAPAHADPSQVSATALDGSDADAVQALEVFCSLLGSATADLALAFGARSVLLAGGFLPRIHAFLTQSGFAHRFLDKGPMRAALQGVPVRLVEHGQLGVVGAARWFLDQAEA